MGQTGRVGGKRSRLGALRLAAYDSVAFQPPPRPRDQTLQFLAHLYDNKGRFKRMLDPLLNRPILKQVLNSGYQPVTLELPLPVRPYPDVIVPDGPACFYRCGDPSGSLTDTMGGPSIPPILLDLSGSMSFGNDAALTLDTTTSLKNAHADPTVGRIIGGSSPLRGQLLNWSIEFMFKTSGPSNRFSPIFQHHGFGDDSRDEICIYIGPVGLAGGTGGTLQFLIRSPNAGLYFFSNTGYTPTQNVWHQCVVTNNNATYSIYVDGALVYSAASGQANPDLAIGFEACAHPGSLQELALYNVTLSAGQVTAHNAARAGAAYRTAIMADAPLRYWRLGDNAGQMVALPEIGDQLLYLQSPVYSQAPLINDDRSVGVAALNSFLGGGFFLDTPKPITGTDWSIEAWVNPDNITKDRAGVLGESYLGGRCIVYVGPVGGVGGLTLAADGPDIRFGFGGSAPAVVANVLTLGRHHLVWTHAPGPVDKLYLDGVLIYTTGLAIGPSTFSGIQIGNCSAAADATWSGLIDEVAVYPLALSATQAGAHFQAGTDMAQGDLVKLTEQGGDASVLYTGIVEDIPDQIDLSSKFEVLLNPLVVELADTFFSVNYSTPTDLAQMVRDAVKMTTHLTYTNESLPLTGILAEVDFTDATALQVVETARKFAGPTYWWFVDATGIVWMQAVNTTLAPMFSTARGDFNARAYRSPINALKNKVLCIGNIPPNKTVPITSLYTNPASQRQYGVRYMHPPLVYPNVADQATLDLVAASVGAMIDRRTTTVELILPNSQLVLLGVNKGATMRYWEPNKNPLLEATVGAGRYSKTYIVLNAELDGPWQKLLLGELPITPDDLQLEAQRIQFRQLMDQVLHPGLSTTVPGAMSGGFFSGQVGQLPTLPAGFTGWSLDAQDGLSLYSGGVLIARYGPSGGAGVLQAYSGFQPVDATHRAILRYELPANVVQSITASHLSFSLKAFRATVQGTSGASSASSSSGTSTTHHHQTLLVDGTGAYSVTFDHITGLNAAGSGGGSAPTSDMSADHTHPIAHTHAITAPDGLYDTGMAQGVHVFVDGTDRTSALGGPWGSGSTLDVSDLDISSWISTTGWHEIQLSSTTLGVIIAQVTTKAQVKTA